MQADAPPPPLDSRRLISFEPVRQIQADAFPARLSAVDFV